MEWIHITSLVTAIEGGKEADLCISAENQDKFYMHFTLYIRKGLTNDDLFNHLFGKSTMTP